MNQPPSVEQASADSRPVAADALSALAVALGIATAILLMWTGAVWLSTLPAAGEDWDQWGHFPVGYLAALLPLAGAAVTLGVRADMLRSMHSGFSGARKVAATASLLAVAGCSWGVQHPNADAAGLFPRHMHEAGFMNPGSTLLKATAATAGTTSYTFDADVPRNEAFALVGNCTSGKITVDSTTIACEGRPHGVVGYCAGGHQHLTVEVSRVQRRTWGLALYRTRHC